MSQKGRRARWRQRCGGAAEPGHELSPTLPGIASGAQTTSPCSWEQNTPTALKVSMLVAFCVLNSSSTLSLPAQSINILTTVTDESDSTSFIVLHCCESHALSSSPAVSHWKGNILLEKWDSGAIVLTWLSWGHRDRWAEGKVWYCSVWAALWDLLYPQRCQELLRASVRKHSLTCVYIHR